MYLRIGTIVRLIACTNVLMVYADLYIHICTCNIYVYFLKKYRISFSGIYVHMYMFLNLHMYVCKYVCNCNIPYEPLLLTKRTHKISTSL